MVPCARCSMKASRVSASRLPQSLLADPSTPTPTFTPASSSCRTCTDQQIAVIAVQHTQDRLSSLRSHHYMECLNVQTRLMVGNSRGCDGKLRETIIC